MARPGTLLLVMLTLGAAACADGGRVTASDPALFDGGTLGPGGRTSSDSTAAVGGTLGPGGRSESSEGVGGAVLDGGTLGPGGLVGEDTTTSGTNAESATCTEQEERGGTLGPGGRSGEPCPTPIL